MKIFDKKRNLSPSVSIGLGGIGGILAFAPLYFELHPYFVIGGMLTGVVIMGFASIALKSATLNLQALTNDPLGWRKAKESYKNDTEQPAKKAGLLGRFFGWKQ